MCVELLPRQIGFKTKMFHGTEILTESAFEKYSKNQEVDESELLNKQEDLKVGDSVYSLSLFGWYKMVVCQMLDGSLYLDSNPNEPYQGVLGYVEFDNCWVTTGHSNKKSFKHIKVGKNE